MMGRIHMNHSRINRKHIIVITVIFIVFIYLINYSPIGLSKLKDITGGSGILDMKLMGYTVEEAYKTLEQLGEEGRAFALQYIAPLDMIFPMIYGIWFFMLLTWRGSLVLPRMKHPWLIGLMGLLGTIFDYMENWNIHRLLTHYPEQLVNTARIANICTRLKGVFLILNMLLLIAGMIILQLRKRKSV